MDFVISEVGTVEADEEEEDGGGGDEEPLFKISKVVTVAKEKRESQTYKSREVRPTKYIKICYVPLCPNTSKSTPEKMFITIPVNPARRKQWLDVVGKTSAGRNPKSPMFCCQDHFNLRGDMKNYEEHLRRGRVQMLLYQTVTPSVFICNNYGHLKRVERIATLRQLHEEREAKLKEQDDDDEDLGPDGRLTARQKSLDVKNRTEPTPNKTVFIEMPAFEYEDHPDFVEMDENGLDTIVIDDSD